MWNKTLVVLYAPDARCKIINTQLTFRCLDLEFSHWKWTHSKEATFVFGMLSILMKIMLSRLYVLTIC